MYFCNTKVHHKKLFREKLFDMSTLQLQKIWEFLQALSLSDDNKEWLANKLIESKGQNTCCDNETEYIKSSPEMLEIIQKGDEEIKRGVSQNLMEKDTIWIMILHGVIGTSMNLTL